MARLKERLFTLLQDPRVSKRLQDPRIQRLVMKGFRFRGRVQGAFEERVQQVAGMLNLATQRDLRALQRRIRHLERELREAEERLTEAEYDGEAPARS
jgi:polyhydroxyalkanoate synthesis regulator phasin